MSRPAVSWAEPGRDVGGDPAATIALTRGDWERHGARFIDADDGQGERPALATGFVDTSVGALTFGVLAYDDESTYLLLSGDASQLETMLEPLLDALVAADVLDRDRDVLDRIAAPDADVDARIADVIELGARRRKAPSGPPVTFYFDVASPWTYLLAERIARRFPDAEWVPMDDALTPSVLLGTDARRTRDEVEQRARQLGMPLVWPERPPFATPRALRATAYAAGAGKGGAFTIAVGRLAYCGGFDVSDPCMLQEAALACGLSVAGTLAAAEADERDSELQWRCNELQLEGCRIFPVVRHSHELYCGEAEITALLSQSPPGLALRSGS